MKYLLLLLLLVAMPVEAEELLTRQELAAYLTKQTSQINALNAQVKALTAEVNAQRIRLATRDSQVEGILLNYTNLNDKFILAAGHINRSIRYATYMMCLANSQVPVYLSWWQPFPTGANECPTTEVVMPTYLRESQGRIYGLEQLP